MLKKVLIGVAVLVVVLLIAIATRPNETHIERTTSIAAPVEVVYAQLADFENFVKWSPWEKLDPNMKKTFGGPKGQVGQTYSWEGNDDVGKGEMKMKAQVQNDHVDYDLHFIAPFESRANITLTTKPAGDKTNVTWHFAGANNFASKAFGMFMDMDSMLGKDFDQGLSNLKSVSEAEAAKRMEEAKKAAEATAAAASAAAAAPPADGAAPPAEPPK